MVFPGGSDGKESAGNTGDLKFDPWVGKIPWRREWQPTAVFLPGKFHGQRSLVGYSPRDHRVEHDLATEQQQQINLCKVPRSVIAIVIIINSLNKDAQSSVLGTGTCP